MERNYHVCIVFFFVFIILFSCEDSNKPSAFYQAEGSSPQKRTLLGESKTTQINVQEELDSKLDNSSEYFIPVRRKKIHQDFIDRIRPDGDLSVIY